MLVIRSSGECVSIPKDYRSITYKELYESPDTLAGVRSVLCLPLFFDWTEHIVRPGLRSSPPVVEILKQYATLGGIVVIVFPHRNWKIEFSKSHREAYKIPEDGDRFTSGEEGTRRLIKSLTGCVISTKDLYSSVDIEGSSTFLTPYLEDYISSSGFSLGVRPYFCVEAGEYKKGKKCKGIGWWGNKEYPFAIASGVEEGCVIVLVSAEGGRFTDETMKAIKQLARGIPNELKRLSKNRRRRKRSGVVLPESPITKFTQKKFASYVNRKERTIRNWLRETETNNLWRQRDSLIDYRLMLAILVSWNKLDNDERENALLKLKDVAENMNLWKEVRNRLIDNSETESLKNLYDPVLLSRLGIRT